MIYLIISMVIVIICAGLSVEVLSFVRADRLAQRGRVSLGFDASLAQDLSGKGAKGSSRATPSSRRCDTPFAKRLRAAGIGIDPALGLMLGVGFVMLLAVFAAVVGSHPLFGVGGALVALAVLYLLLKRRIQKRAELFDMQLAQALPRIAASVRGALTFERALRVAVIHMEDPLREEFVHVLSDTAYGMPLYEALSGMAVRTQNDDVTTLANATKVRHGSGGSISAVLSLVSSRVNARLQAARELKVEIAGTRMAKWFVAAAMPALFMIMYVTNAGFARFYAEEPLGWTVLGVAVVMEVVGLLASQSITSVGRS